MEQQVADATTIRLGGKGHALIDLADYGTFDTEEAAAHRYDQAARLHFGAFARTNYPLPEVPA